MFPIEMASTDAASTGVAMLLAAKAVEGAAGELGRSTVGLLERGFGHLRRHLQSDRKASSALELVEADPSDEQGRAPVSRGANRPRRR